MISIFPKAKKNNPCFCLLKRNKNLSVEAFFHSRHLSPENRKVDETRYRSEEITPGPVNENTNKLKEQRNRNMLGNRGDMLTMPM